MQQMLVDEVTGFLGRVKHQRRGVDMQEYRNGYGKLREAETADDEERYDHGAAPAGARCG